MENNDRKFVGIWFPSCVWLDKSMSITHKAMLIEINALDNEDGCYASNNHFSEFLGLTRVRCSQLITDLKKDEYIITELKYKGKQIVKRTIRMTKKGCSYLGGVVNMDKGGSKNTLKGDNNISTIINNSITHSSNESNLFIEFWNKYKHIRQHKKPNTKIYKLTAKKLNYLQKGTLSKHFTIDKSFLKKHNISAKLLRHEFTEEEIKSTISRLADYCRPGYFPGCGNTQKPSLSDLIHNADSGTSIFLWVFVQAPEQQGHEAVDKYPELSNLYLKLFEKNMKLTARHKNLIIRYTNALIKDHSEIIESVGEYYSHTSFSVHIAKPERFIQQHIKWLTRNETNFRLTNMNPTNRNYSYFITYMEEFHGFILKPCAEELEKIKTNYNRAMKRHSSRSA